MQDIVNKMLLTNYLGSSFMLRLIQPVMKFPTVMESKGSPAFSEKPVIAHHHKSV
jgi:hypothetical protein